MGIWQATEWKRIQCKIRKRRVNYAILLIAFCHAYNVYRNCPYAVLAV